MSFEDQQVPPQALMNEIDLDWLKGGGGGMNSDDMWMDANELLGHDSFHLIDEEELAVDSAVTNGAVVLSQQILPSQSSSSFQPQQQQQQNQQRPVQIPSMNLPLHLSQQPLQAQPQLFLQQRQQQQQPHLMSLQLLQQQQPLPVAAPVTVSSSAPTAQHNNLSAAAVRLPDSAADHMNVDRLLASDLAKLSMQEREQAMEDLHGIVHYYREEESPPVLAGLLDQVQSHLDGMKWLPTASAYRRAVAQDAAYVKASRLLFLRADRYQPLEAAQRMLRFFQLKLELWGQARLCKKITIVEDFSEQDKEALRQGSLTVAPYQDSAKRVIFYGVAALKHVEDERSQLRAQFYTYMNVVEENEEAQRRGVVFVALDIPPEYRSNGMRFRDTIPVFFAAIHAHITDKAENVSVITKEGITVFQNPVGKKKQQQSINGGSQLPKVPVIMKQAAKEQSLQKRVRYRNYKCKREDALRQMMAFGIPMAAAPIAIDGSYDLQNHLQWVEKRIEAETNEKKLGVPSTIAVSTGSADAVSVVTEASAAVVCRTASSSDEIISDSKIRNNDVLFGKEKKVVNHPGNAKFRQVIDHYLPAYEAAPRGEKTNITKVIVDHMHGANGRFLKRGTGAQGDSWVEVDTETSHDKITHAFRNRRKYHANRPRPSGS